MFLQNRTGFPDASPLCSRSQSCSAGYHVSTFELSARSASDSCMGSFTKVNLLNPDRCSDAMKSLMKEQVNTCESFDATGLSLQIMNLGEFWINEKFVQSTHRQWAALCTTTSAACLDALTLLFSRQTAGKGLGSATFRATARRLAVFHNMMEGVFKRRGLSQQTIQALHAKVQKGQYNDDLDAMIEDLDEEVDEGGIVVCSSCLTRRRCSLVLFVPRSCPVSSVATVAGKIYYGGAGQDRRATQDRRGSFTDTWQMNSQPSPIERSDLRRRPCGSRLPQFRELLHLPGCRGPGRNREGGVTGGGRRPGGSGRHG